MVRLLQKLGTGWWRHPAAGRDQGRGAQSVRWPAITWREHPEDLPAAERPHSARAHVPDAAALRLRLPADATEHHWHSAHPANCRRLQDKAGVAHPCRKPIHAQHLLQCLVERAVIQTNARLLKIRLFPDDVCHRRTAACRRHWPGRLQHGRA